MIKVALYTVGLIFIGLLLTHWLTAGVTDIVEGPPETPEVSCCQ